MVDAYLERLRGWLDRLDRLAEELREQPPQQSHEQYEALVASLRIAQVLTKHLIEARASASDASIRTPESDISAVEARLRVPQYDPSDQRFSKGPPAHVREQMQVTKARLQEKNRRTAYERERAQARAEAIRDFFTQLSIAEERLRAGQVAQNQDRRRPGRQRGSYQTITDEELLDRARRVWPVLVDRALEMGKQRIFVTDLGAEVVADPQGLDEDSLSIDQFKVRWRRLEVQLPSLPSLGRN